MDAFYTIVLSIAIILLIAILSYIGVKMTNNTSSVAIYPPTSLPCPDYWAQSKDPNGNTVCFIPPYVAANSSSQIPSNTGKIYGADGANTLNSSTPGYLTNNNSINFSNPGWASSGTTSVCAQKKWANSNLIQWDGVSNFSSC
jgi:hypothetical protein